AMLSLKLERDLLPSHANVLLAEGRDPEGPGFLCIALGADAKPAGIDQPGCDRRHALTVQHVLVHVLCRSGAQVGQALRESDQPIELRLVLLRTKRRVREVLLATGGVDAGRLQLGARAWRDPDVLPGRRDDERLEGRDRKSTRLNSSHGSISYAVFCLKKKNN